jgi:hypothetical protein
MAASTSAQLSQLTGPITGQDEDDLIPKPGTKLLVWEYFGLKKDAQGKAVDDGRVVYLSC